MHAAISITYILDKLTDLLPLTYEQLKGMTSKQLRDDVAKILGIGKAYQLKKAELLDACWRGLENVRNQLQVDEESRQWGKVALTQLKKNEDYLIPVAEVADIATALAVRTLGVGRTPSHHVDTQTDRAACEFDF